RDLPRAWQEPAAPPRLLIEPASPPPVSLRRLLRSSILSSFLGMTFSLVRLIRRVAWVLLLAAPWPGLQATTVLPPDFDTLVNRSDYVVRARVIAAEPQLTTTADRWKIHTL